MSLSLSLLSRHPISGRHVGSAATHVFPISPRVFRGSMSVWPARVSLDPHTLRFRVSAAARVGHLLHDAGATAAVLVGAYGLVLSFDNLSQRKLIQQNSTSTEARYFAALVPLVNCLRLVINGLSLVKDDGLIKSVTREGNPKELLRGPLYYVLMLILSALVFWRDSPVGVISLSMMCGGDGNISCLIPT
ncbi:Phytol kinase 1 [Citrus sinensis]|nr:Phytol kinase 1 [Citrus sinensis]